MAGHREDGPLLVVDVEAHPGAKDVVGGRSHPPHPVEAQDAGIQSAGRIGHKATVVQTTLGSTPTGGQRVLSPS